LEARGKAKDYHGVSKFAILKEGLTKCSLVVGEELWSTGQSYYSNLKIFAMNIDERPNSPTYNGKL
jgi:hypothetical protein